MSTLPHLHKAFCPHRTPGIASGTELGLHTSAGSVTPGLLESTVTRGAKHAPLTSGLCPRFPSECGPSWACSNPTRLGFLDCLNPQPGSWGAGFEPRPFGAEPTSSLTLLPSLGLKIILLPGTVAKKCSWRKEHSGATPMAGFGGDRGHRRQGLGELQRFSPGFLGPGPHNWLCQHPAIPHTVCHGPGGGQLRGWGPPSPTVSMAPDSAKAPVPPGGQCGVTDSRCLPEGGELGLLCLSSPRAEQSPWTPQACASISALQWPRAGHALNRKLVTTDRQMVARGKVRVGPHRLCSCPRQAGVRPCGPVSQLGSPPGWPRSGVPGYMWLPQAPILCACLVACSLICGSISSLPQITPPFVFLNSEGTQGPSSSNDTSMIFYAVLEIIMEMTPHQHPSGKTCGAMHSWGVPMGHSGLPPHSPQAAAPSPSPSLVPQNAKLGDHLTMPDTGHLPGWVGARQRGQTGAKGQPEKTREGGRASILGSQGPQPAGTRSRPARRYCSSLPQSLPGLRALPALTIGNTAGQAGGHWLGRWLGSAATSLGNSALALLQAPEALVPRVVPTCHLWSSLGTEDAKKVLLGSGRA